MIHHPSVNERILQAIETAPDPGARRTVHSFAEIARFNVAQALSELPAGSENRTIYEKALQAVNETFHDKTLLHASPPYGHLHDRIVGLIQEITGIRPDTADATGEEAVA